jgi:hypothetical protein
MLDTTLLPDIDLVGRGDALRDPRRGTAAEARPRFAPPPMRDRLPTLPFDLTEYARIHTGPESWSAHADHVLDELGADFVDALFDEMASGPLVGIHGTDVPHVAVCVTEPDVSPMTDEESIVFGLIDGRSCVEDLLAIAGMPPAEVLAAFCTLCARGMVSMR